MGSSAPAKIGGFAANKGNDESDTEGNEETDTEGNEGADTEGKDGSVGNEIGVGGRVTPKATGVWDEVVRKTAADGDGDPP